MNELKTQFPTGNKLYAVILNSVGQVWNGTAFETITAADWASYAVALTESAGSGIYIGNFPSAIAAGAYSLLLRQMAGASAADTDAPVGAAPFRWSGAVELLPVTPVDSVSSVVQYTGS